MQPVGFLIAIGGALPFGLLVSFVAVGLAVDDIGDYLRARVEGGNLAGWCQTIGGGVKAWVVSESQRKA